MNKLEIEKAIVEECKKFIPELKGSKFDEKALASLRENLWNIADKYNTDGDNVFNIMMKHFKEFEKGDENA